MSVKSSPTNAFSFTPAPAQRANHRPSSGAAQPEIRAQHDAPPQAMADDDAQTRDKRGLGGLRGGGRPRPRGRPRPAVGSLSAATTGINSGRPNPRPPPSPSSRHTGQALQSTNTAPLTFGPLAPDAAPRPVMHEARPVPGPAWETVSPLPDRQPPSAVHVQSRAPAPGSPVPSDSGSSSGSVYSGGSGNGGRSNGTSSWSSASGYRGPQVYRPPNSDGTSPASSLSKQSSPGQSRPISPASIGTDDSYADTRGQGQRNRHVSTSSVESGLTNVEFPPSDTSRPGSAASAWSYGSPGRQGPPRPSAHPIPISPLGTRSTSDGSLYHPPTRPVVVYQESFSLSAASSAGSVHSNVSQSSQASTMSNPPPRVPLGAMPADSWVNRTGHVERVGAGHAYYVRDHAERNYFRPEQEGLSSDQNFPSVPRMQDGEVARLFLTQEAAQADFRSRNPIRPGEPLVTFDSYQVNVEHVRVALSADNYVAPAPGAGPAGGEIHVRTRDIPSERIRRL